MRIIAADDQRFIVLSVRKHVGEESLEEWIEQTKNQHYLCDKVLRLSDEYYFCSQIIDAEFKEVTSNDNR